MDKNNKPNKPWYKKWWIWVIIVIVVGAIGSAGAPKDDAAKVTDSNSTSPTEKTEEQTTFKAGDTISFDDKKVTVSAAERNWNSGNQFIKPESGNEFIKVQVTIENNSKSEASYNTFDWDLQDSNGVIKSVSSAAFTLDGALNSGELAPGGKVSGFLVFEVPADDTGLTLRYNASFWTDKKIEIKL